MEVPSLGEYEKTDWPEPQKGYAAMVSRMDGDIGRLFALLKELKIDDNTLVIFTSDNGPHQEGGFNPRYFDSNGPFRGFKGNVTDGGIHEPMIARWPGHVPTGKTTDSPVYFADMMPTFSKLAGAKAPSWIDGVDILPTLEGHDQPELSNRFMYWEFDKDGVVAQSARFGKWKAVRDPKTEKIELFDLSNDAGEAHNVADQNAETLAKFTEYFRTARHDSPTWPMVVKDKAGAKSRATSAE
jgi:arylsulfatase A-like enzyme